MGRNKLDHKRKRNKTQKECLKRKHWSTPKKYNRTFCRSKLAGVMNVKTFVKLQLQIVVKNATAEW